MSPPRRAVALIDGEHYPAVVVDALAQASDRFEFRAALFLGGTEKITTMTLETSAEEVYGLPVLFNSDWDRGLRSLIEQYRPEAVVDLSDEPVLGYEERFRLISLCLAERVVYIGSDFHFNPTSSDRLCVSPSLSIIGTGKRVGKTAISGFVARTLKSIVLAERGTSGLVLVAMGRGGPPRPEVIDGAKTGLAVADLLAWSRQGRHAASDCYEDAALSGLLTVGCWRCGGGMAGEPFASNVVEGIRVANSLDPGFVILEGSGACLPPVGTDARLVVCGAQQPTEYVGGFLGAYRLLTSDAVVVTMAEEPLATREKVRAVMDAARKVKQDLTVIPTVFRPKPAEQVSGKRVAFFTTAPAVQADLLRRYLEEHFECRVAHISVNLSNRVALERDLSRLDWARLDAVLTEIKAAAIDVVAE
ncbi:MAG: 2,3-diphosphoglycerate synthetase, partial [Actinobacteria bacterium]|nr:2,3-diphosphoglycerate synthetase [Actinomycetota bacterium]